MGELSKTRVAITFMSNKSNVSEDKIGLFLGRYVHKLYELEPERIHFFTPVSFLEIALMEFGYNSVKEFSLKSVVTLAEEYIPSFVRKNVRITYDI